MRHLLMCDWSEYWTKEEIEKQISLDFRGPGWYVGTYRKGEHTHTDVVLVTTGSNVRKGVKLEDGCFYHVYVFNMQSYENLVQSMGTILSLPVFRD